jgi:hypothetical protein
VDCLERQRPTAYALSVLGAMFLWLIEQHYLLANPFAGVKARGSSRSTEIDTSHAFTEGDWMLVRAIADGLEWSYGWGSPAGQRLRFVLDFAYAPGLRARELFGACLSHIETTGHTDPMASDPRSSAALNRTVRHASAVYGYGRLHGAFSKAAEVIEADNPVLAESCVARARTRLDIHTPLTRSHAVPI